MQAVQRCRVGAGLGGREWEDERVRRLRIVEGGRHPGRGASRAPWRALRMARRSELSAENRRREPRENQRKTTNGWLHGRGQAQGTVCRGSPAAAPMFSTTSAAVLHLAVAVSRAAGGSTATAGEDQPPGPVDSVTLSAWVRLVVAAAISQVDCHHCPAKPQHGASGTQLGCKQGCALAGQGRTAGGPCTVT